MQTSLSRQQQSRSNHRKSCQSMGGRRSTMGWTALWWHAVTAVAPSILNVSPNTNACASKLALRGARGWGARGLQDVRPWSVAGSKPQSKWRQQHAEFIAAVQSQRGHGGGGSGATADQHHLAAERPRSRALSTAPGYNRSGLHAAIAPPSRGGLRCHTSASSRCSTVYSQASTALRHTLASASGEPRAADRPSLSLARREHVASRGDGGGGSLGRQKMPMRRPTPAQRHATEWFQLEQIQSPSAGAPPPPAAVTRRQLSHHQSPQKQRDAIGALPWPTAVGPAAALHGARQVAV